MEQDAADDDDDDEQMRKNSGGNGTNWTGGWHLKLTLCCTGEDGACPREIPQGLPPGVGSGDLRA